MKTGIYRHYKGGYYQILGIGQHTETSEIVVIYVSLSYRAGPRLRVRPLWGPEGFLTPVSESPNTKTERFIWVRD